MPHRQIHTLRRLRSIGPCWELPVIGYAAACNRLHYAERLHGGRKGLIAACALGCESIVSKRLGSPYRHIDPAEPVTGSRQRTRRQRRSSARPMKIGHEAWQHDSNSASGHGSVSCSAIT
jgi:hypothetical protein